MSKKPRVEIIARGVFVRDGQVLLCQSRGAGNTYLPGGHVEFDESAKVALAREIEEEMGCEAVVGEFLGAVEHQFVQKGKPHCEVNLVFAFEIPGLGPDDAPPVAEDHLTFHWCAMPDLDAAVLEPAPLRSALPEWLATAGQAGWASTF